MEQVDNYICLGQIMSFKDKMGKEIEKRMSPAWKGYWTLRSMFKGNSTEGSKIKMLESCIMPILKYEAQTWLLTDAQIRRLVATPSRMERSILGLRKKGKIS